MSGQTPEIPIREDVPEAIRACFCRECGLIAPWWFHSDFVLGHDGFTCIWCAFPSELVTRPKPPGALGIVI